MNPTAPHGELTESAGRLVDALLAGNSRLLLWGETGSGKTTLATELARELARRERPCRLLGADPGSPGFGVPGALCAGLWEEDGWVTTDLEPLCTLDAARFRLPLVTVLGRLLARLQGDAPLLLDAPGVTRGVAGAELLRAIAEAGRVDAVLALARAGCDPPLRAELASLGLPLWVVASAPQAHRPTKRARARQRTVLWDAYLRDAVTLDVDTAALGLTGTPPPEEAPAAWKGRQVALRRRQGAMLGLGEIIDKTAGALQLRMRLWRPQRSEVSVPVIPLRQAGDEAGSSQEGLARPAGGSDDGVHETGFPLVANLVLVIRDACRDAAGLLGTAPPPVPPTVRYQLPPDMAPAPELGMPVGPRPVAQLGAATAILINGVFGDPLLHLRLRQHRRSLLFDLGEAVRLPARIAHQVSDVFVSHAHIDHIGGFLWFLRSRIGQPAACRLYGPPGLAEHIRGMVSGILWDRIGEGGPCFVVAELHAERLRRWRVQAGVPGLQPLDEVPARGGVLRDEPAFRVRAATLDHGTPVLAFAFEPAAAVNVDKAGLARRGLPAGPWVGELKRRVASGDRGALIRLPDGRRESVAALAEALLRVTPGQKLAYATDLADTPENRARLTALASAAHTFFCEAGFAQEDVEQARATGHLTARACGEIATTAGVERLVPFHFSRRYEASLDTLYREVRSACSRTVVPEGVSMWP